MRYRCAPVCVVALAAGVIALAPGAGFAQSQQTTQKSAAAGYRGLLGSFKIRRMAAIVFQFRVVAGAP